MNKFIKALVAIFGATNAVFGMFMPLAVALMLVNMMELGELQASAILIAAIISSIYRAVRIGIMK